MKIIHFILLLSTTALLSACTPGYAFYFRNFLNEKIQVTMKFEDENERYDWMRSEYLSARKNLEPREDYQTRRLKDSIEVKKIDSVTVQYYLPPKSIVL